MEDASEDTIETADDMARYIAAGDPSDGGPRHYADWEAIG